MEKSENLVNMERCSRFQVCDIPKCPLDIDMKKRVELHEDERCPLAMKTKGKRRGGNLTSQMKGLLKFVYKKNAK